MAMQKLAKIIAVSLLGLAYTLATPVISVSVFDDGISSTKAYADVPRDPGRVAKERNKDNPG
jgi:hypothetical protein